nr:protein RKD1-like [Ipomoea batatas]
MAHYAFSSSSSNQVECPCSDYSEHYIWDYQYEALPLTPTNQTIGFAKQFSEIGQEFDDLWDFKAEAERLNLIARSFLKKICKKVGIDQWPYKKLRTLERLAKNVQGNTDHREIINELENQREQMLKDPNLQSGIERNKLEVSYFKKRKYRNLTELSYYAPLASSSYVSANPLPKTKNEDTM